MKIVEFLNVMIMKIRIYALLFAFVFLGACAEDKKIEEIQITDPDYVLPQGEMLPRMRLF